MFFRRPPPDDETPVKPLRHPLRDARWIVSASSVKDHAWGGRRLVIGMHQEMVQRYLCRIAGIFMRNHSKRPWGQRLKSKLGERRNGSSMRRAKRSYFPKRIVRSNGGIPSHTSAAANCTMLHTIHSIKRCDTDKHISQSIIRWTKSLTMGTPRGVKFNDKRSTLERYGRNHVIWTAILVQQVRIKFQNILALCNGGLGKWWASDQDKHRCTHKRAE